MDLPPTPVLLSPWGVTCVGSRSSDLRTESRTGPRAGGRSRERTASKGTCKQSVQWGGFGPKIGLNASPLLRVVIAQKPHRIAVLVGLRSLYDRHMRVSAS